VSAITKEASVTTKNISTVVLLKIAQYPFLALAAMLIPRIMGPEVYGEYALLLSIIAITASLVSLGLTEIFGRFIPEFENRGESANIKRLSSNFLTLKGAIDIISCIILFLVLHFVFGDRFSDTYFLLIIAILLANDWGYVPYSLLFGLNKLGKFASRDLIRRAMSLILILILFHYYGLLGAIMSTLLVEVFFTALTFFWTREYFRIEDFRVDWSFLKPYLSFGFIFYISWALLNLWQRLGNPMIEYMTNDATEVALFDIPNQIFLLTATFTLVVICSFVPIFTKLLLAQKEAKLINWSSLIMKYTGILCTMIFWAYVLAGADLIPIIIGSEYKDIFPNGIVLLLGIFPMIFAQLGILFSIVYKEPRRYFLALCFAFSAFLLGSILLIPRYASMGCSIATFISCVVLALVIYIYFRDKFHLCLMDGLKTIALGLIFVPFLFIRGNLFTNLLLVVCSVLGYIVLLFVSRVLNLIEVREIFQAIRHRPQE